MGMPCEVNSILKLSEIQGYPEKLLIEKEYDAIKDGYRIIPVDVPIPLVDQSWTAYADVVIKKLIWQKGKTQILFTIDRIYECGWNLK